MTATTFDISPSFTSGSHSRSSETSAKTPVSAYPSTKLSDDTKKSLCMFFPDGPFDLKHGKVSNLKFRSMSQKEFEEVSQAKREYDGTAESRDAFSFAGGIWVTSGTPKAYRMSQAWPSATESELRKGRPGPGIAAQIKANNQNLISNITNTILGSASHIKPSATQLAEAEDLWTQVLIDKASAQCVEAHTAHLQDTGEDEPPMSSTYQVPRSVCFHGGSDAGPGASTSVYADLMSATEFAAKGVMRERSDYERVAANGQNLNGPFSYRPVGSKIEGHAGIRSLFEKFCSAKTEVMVREALRGKAWPTERERSDARASALDEMTSHYQSIVDRELKGHALEASELERKRVLLVRF